VEVIPLKKIRLNLQEILNDKKISQNELARRLELSASTVNDMCKKDIKRVNIETLSKIINMPEFNDVGINDLFIIVEEKKTNG
jgi:putative transcriptional regulator